MNTCNKSTPHIYISALPFCYKSNFVYGNYWPKTQGLIRVNGSSLDEKRSGPIATWHIDYEVESLASSHNGTSFATGSWDGVHIYDAGSGEMIAGPLKARGRPSNFSDHLVTFSPDNTKLASVCRDTICIWDVQTGTLIAGPLRKHPSFITSLSFSSDSTKLVSGDYDSGAIIVWDSTTGDVISGPLQSTDRVDAVGFTPDGFKIVSVYADCKIRIWDAEKGTILSGPFQAISTEHEPWISELVYSPDGRAIAAAFSNRCVGLWDAQTGKEILPSFQPHTEDGNIFISFSPDSTNLVTSEDLLYTNTIRIWDLCSGSIIEKPMQVLIGDATISHIAFSPDDTILVLGGMGG
ncbi:WD40 repeat-like protein, partial [Agrocybe pediades]